MSPRRTQILGITASSLTCGGFTSRSGRLILERWDEGSVDPEWTTNLPQFEHLLPKLAAFAARQPKRPCTLLLPAHLVLTKIVSVSSGGADGAILDPAEHVPLALSDVVWSWQDLHAGDPNRTVWVVAARRVHVERLCEVVAEAGLIIERVVPAVAGLLAGLARANSATAIASLDVRSTLLAAASGSRRLVRTIPMGTSHLEAGAARLEKELTRTLAHWTEAFGLQPPDVLQIAGADLSNGFTSGWSLRVAHHAIDAESDRAAETTLPHSLRPEMVGAARAALLDDESLIELSPDSLVRERKTRKRSRARVVAAALVVAALLPPLLYHRQHAAGTIRRAQVLEQELRVVTSLQSANAARLRDLEQVRARVAALWPACLGRDSWSRFLSELQDGAMAVGDTWLERLQVLAGDGRPTTADGRRLRVAGRVAVQDATLAGQRARQLLSGLARSTFVSALEGEQFESAADGSLRFAVTLVLKTDSPL
jgi:hypothetical protein